jgi:hypothetical protein
MSEHRQRSVNSGGLVGALVGFSVLLSLVFLVLIGMMIAGIVLWIWAFLDILKKDDWMFASGTWTLWAIVVGLGGPPVGAVIYLAVGRARPARA